MALSVDYLYSFARKLIRKNQSGSLSADDFNKHWNDASNTYLDDLVGRFQPNAIGKTGVNTGLIQNKTILQKLAPFTKTTPLAVNSGSANKPSDFIYMLALRINGVDVIPATHDQKGSINSSVIDPPSASDDKYYFSEILATYSFLPSTFTGFATLDYISNPVDVVWAYTLDGQDRQVYNAGASVQSLWDDHSNREITKRMLTNLGVSLKDPDFAQFGAKIQAQGE